MGFEPIPADQRMPSVKWPGCGHALEYDSGGRPKLCSCYDGFDEVVSSAFDPVFSSIGLVNPFRGQE